MSTPAASAPPMHRAARTEDLINRALSRFLTRRGWTPRVLPYTGYGRAYVPAGGTVGTASVGDAPTGAGPGAAAAGDAAQAPAGRTAGPDDLSQGWVRILARVLLSPPAVTDRGERSVRGWRHFMSGKLAGVPVTVRIGGTRHVVESSRGGYIDAVLPVRLPAGWTTASLSAPGALDSTAPIRVVGPEERLGVISDIDDTVLVTALPRPLLAFWNTFVRHEESRRPVPGTAELFRTLTGRAPDVFVVYVSTGAWNVAPALQRFLRRRGLPAGPMLLTDWGPTPDGWFRSGQDHKRATLRRLMDELPQLRWILVGDDGQHDPQLYDELVWARPERVRAVLIRQLGPAEQVLTHGLPMPLAVSREVETRGGRRSVPWVLGVNGHALVASMQRAGVLDDATLRP